MQRDTIESKVVTILATILRVPLDAKATRDTLAEWDSLKHIEIVFALEEELDVQFSDVELAELNSVASIVKAVEERHAA